MNSSNNQLPKELQVMNLRALKLHSEKAPRPTHRHGGSQREPSRGARKLGGRLGLAALLTIVSLLLTPGTASAASSLFGGSSLGSSYGSSSLFGGSSLGSSYSFKTPSYSYTPSYSFKTPSYSYTPSYSFKTPSYSYTPRSFFKTPSYSFKTPSYSYAPNYGCGSGYYENAYGSCTRSPSKKYSFGATAICRDRTYSFSRTRSGTCSWHGGVSSWR